MVEACPMPGLDSTHHAMLSASASPPRNARCERAASNPCRNDMSGPPSCCTDDDGEREHVVHRPEQIREVSTRASQAITEDTHAHERKTQERQGDQCHVRHDQAAIVACLLGLGGDVELDGPAQDHVANGLDVEPEEREVILLAAPR